METASALDRLLNNGKIEFALPRWSVFLFVPVSFFLFLDFFSFVGALGLNLLKAGLNGSRLWLVPAGICGIVAGMIALSGVGYLLAMWRSFLGVPAFTLSRDYIQRYDGKQILWNRVELVRTSSLDVGSLPDRLVIAGRDAEGRKRIFKIPQSTLGRVCMVDLSSVVMERVPSTIDTSQVNGAAWMR